jgi:predicted flap endonuclease-1-like 5' DNA nuclease
MFKKIRGKFILIGLLAFFWWLIRRPRPETDQQSAKSSDIEIPLDNLLPGTVPEAAVELTQEELPPAAPAEDNLTIISGIGPKINGILHAAGITTYAQLAGADSAQLWSILEAAGVRLAKPDTWIAQAQALTNL